MVSKPQCRRPRRLTGGRGVLQELRQARLHSHLIEISVEHRSGLSRSLILYVQVNRVAFAYLQLLDTPIYYHGRADRDKLYSG